MGLNSTEVAYGFGQMGSGYLDDTGALTPPTGSVIVAITCIDATKFTTLTADTSYYEAADGSDGIAFIGTAAQVTSNGANSEAIASADEFPKGVTIYGRWTACTLASGKVIVYYGPAS
tara:strand:- start:1420 stop:1773 length:354 start_codon:yes stop_codon:yes gene_type:complete